MSENLDKFITDAVRTESTIEAVEVNERLLTGIIQSIISLGNVLDMLKKNTFYGKEIDLGAAQYHLAIANDTIGSIAQMTAAEIVLKNRLPVNPRLFHAIVGTVTEGVELLEALNLYRPELDNINILEEFFDINWYEAIAIDELGGDFQNILDQGIAKLRARFPDKFTSEDAINRDVGAEREILDKMLDQPEK